MGKLAERLAKVPEPRRCRIGKIEAEMDTEDLSAWKQAVEKVMKVDPKDRARGTTPYTVRWLCESLRAEGIKVDVNSLTPHFTGMCGCEHS